MTESGAKRSRSNAMWSRPFSRGNTSAGSVAIRSRAGLIPAALVATINTSTGSVERLSARGCATNSPRLTLWT